MVSLGYSSENVSEMRDMADNLNNELWQMQIEATETLKDYAREFHDYGVYCMVGAVFVGIGGVGWMIWRFMKEKESPTLSSKRIKSPAK